MMQLFAHTTINHHEEIFISICWKFENVQITLFFEKNILLLFLRTALSVRVRENAVRERSLCGELFFNKWKKISIKNNTISLESRLAARGCAFLLATPNVFDAIFTRIGEKKLYSSLN
jgi:hypothetical protein